MKREQRLRTKEAEMFTRIHEPDQVSIRLAGPGDEAAVERLAALETRDAPEGDLLLAENGHEVVAVLPIDGGTALADPFQRTAEVVELLALRAHQLDTGRHAA
jgi:hypothetical protein